MPNLLTHPLDDDVKSGPRSKPMPLMEVMIPVPGPSNPVESRGDDFDDYVPVTSTPKPVRSGIFDEFYYR